MNVVHLHVVPDDRRERTREKKRQRFLEAALAIVERDGLGAVTMQAVADELDCAVGTIYRYFPSKASLLVSLQARAVQTLRASCTAARDRWEEQLDTEHVPAELAALVEVLAFGSFWAAASVVYADEFELARQLLAAKVTLVTAEDIAAVLPVARQLLALPAELVDEAVNLGLLEPGRTDERVLRWLAGLNGILLLENLAPLDRHLFRPTHLARRLTHDLLVGWGADRAQLEVADGHVDRLTATGPMAPPVEDPPW